MVRMMAPKIANHCKPFPVKLEPFVATQVAPTVYVSPVATCLIEGPQGRQTPMTTSAVEECCTEVLTCKSHVTHGVNRILSNEGPVGKPETVVEPTENNPSDPLIEPSYTDTVDKSQAMENKLQSEGLFWTDSSGREWPPRSVDFVFSDTCFSSLIVNIEWTENNPNPQSNQGHALKGLAKCLMILRQIGLGKPSKDSKNGLGDDDIFDITSSK